MCGLSTNSPLWSESVIRKPPWYTEPPDRWQLQSRPTTIPNFTHPRSSHFISRLAPEVDYGAVDALNSIEGLRGAEFEHDTSLSAHDHFMSVVSKMFKPDAKAQKMSQKEAEKSGARLTRRPETATANKPPPQAVKEARRQMVRKARRSSYVVGGPAVANKGSEVATPRYRTRAQRYNPDAWLIMDLPYYRRSKEGLEFLATWAKGTFDFIRKTFTSTKELNGMLEMARFEAFPKPGFKVAGDYEAEFFAVVLVGGVLIHDPQSKSKVRLGPGEGFGATAGAISASIVVTNEPTDLLIFSNEDWLRVKGRIENVLSNKKLDSLAIFPQLDRWRRLGPQFKPVLHNLYWRRYQAGTVISRQGAIAPFLGFLVDGECDIVRKVDLQDTLARPASSASAASAASRSSSSSSRTSNLADGAVKCCLGQIGKGHYFGENCGLNVSLKGWDLNRPTTIVETFSVVAKTDVTLLAMTPKGSHKIEPYFGLQFFLANNPHGYNTLGQIQLVAACIQEKDRQAWLDFKQDILRSTRAGDDYLPNQKIDVDGLVVPPPSEFRDISAPTPAPASTTPSQRHPAVRHMGSVGFEINF